MSFYSVYIPQKTNQDSTGNAIHTCVFREKNEALKVLKKHKDARLKVFANKDDATKYAETGYEECLSTKYPDSKSSSPLNLEKAAFRAPTRQELIAFRKMIEAGEHTEVHTKIWENPRFLISSGDTPTSLKEGYRYNAMHICAISNQAHVAALILETVSNTAFIELLYGKKNRKVYEEASGIILDYFLNMPEKGRYETPLHLAAKIGAVEMVEVLTSYPQCKMTPNSEGQLPKDIICKRSRDRESYGKILSLLEERFYVPVIRSANNIVPPTIGQPFSASSPPNLNSDPLSPEVEIRAVAGPMSKEKAKRFCRRWKTPPRLNSNSLPLSNSTFLSPGQIRSSTPTKHTPKLNISLNPPRKCLFSIRSKDINTEEDDNISNNSDLNKTNELIEDNNNGNNGNGFNMNLMTPFRKKKDIFSAYRENMNASPVVLDLTDSIAGEQHFDSPGFTERNLKLIDAEKGFEIIGRELAKEHYVEWREYWDFLGIFVDIASEQGLTKLENYLTEREKAETKVTKPTECKELMDDLCSAFDKLQLHNERMSFGECDSDLHINNKAVSNNVPQSTMPYTCVEKSLQVFAKRMTKNLLYNIDSIVSINDAFLSELKRLKSLIVSFMDDPRFLNVNFAKVHSRFSYLIVSYLDDAQHIGKASKAKIQKCLEQIISSPGERREHLLCVCNKMLSYTNAVIVIEQPENLKTEESCMEIWRQESHCDCKWDSVVNRKESRRSRKNRPLIATSDHVNDNKPEESPQSQTETVLELSENEDVFWSDIGSDDDADECFMTPPESQSALSFSSIDDKDYHLFLLGNEPTKRDIDVLNAIFNVQISHDTYPHIYNWKTALLRYSIGEMEHFPSPLLVAKKTLFSSSVQLPAPRILFNSPLLKNNTMESSKDNQLSNSCPVSDANENSSDVAYFNDKFV